MPRRYTSGSGYYHVYNRSNNRQTIFHDQSDYGYFIKKTYYAKIKYKIDIICYCIMPNHFHFFIRSEDDRQLALFMKDIQMSYAKYLHNKYNSFGHIFQGKYKCKIVNGLEYSLYLTTYIHNNPKIAGLVDHISNWQWSSYPDFKGIRNGKIPNTKIILENFQKPKDYFNWIEKVSDDKIEEKLGNLKID